MRTPLLMLLALLLPLDSPAATVWGGPMLIYVQPSSDTSDAANWDRLSDAVAITRGSSHGPFNPLNETAWSDPSPAGTEWAFPSNNSVTRASIVASNHAVLNFDPWRTAVRSNPPGSVGEPAVLHLIAEDIYLDVEFTSWRVRAGDGGGFGWKRSTPVPEPSSAGLLAGALGFLAYSSRASRSRASRAASTPSASRR